MNKLKPIGQGYGPSFGSITDVWIAPASALLEPWRLDSISLSASVALFSSNIWLQVKPAVNRFRLTEKCKMETGGLLVETELTGTVLTDNDAVRDALLAMCQSGLVLIVTNGDGQRRIMGNKGTPARASISFDTGNSLKDSNGFQLTVAWISQFGAIPYAYTLAASNAGSGGVITQPGGGPLAFP